MGRSFVVGLVSAVGLLGGSVLLAGCPKQPEVTQAPPSAVGPAVAAPRATTSNATPSVAETPVTRSEVPAEPPVVPTPPAVVAAPLKDIFFAFDDATLRGDQRANLEKDFAYLKAHPEVRVRVEGNCDERGTEEYNLALGERRADAVKQALVAEGIAPERLTAESFGKEKPFMRGHTEDAWRQNRRDHFVLVAVR